MKKYLFSSSLLLLLTVSAVELVNKNGLYTLENKHLSVTVSPASGGRVIRFFDKKNKEELTNNHLTSQAPTGSGLFSERLWPVKGRQFRHYESSAYKVLNARADKSSAELSLVCKSNPLDIEKTYILRENERTLHVRYSLSNPGSTPFTGRFWVCNVITPQGEQWDIQLPEGFYSSDFRKKGKLAQPVLRHNTQAPRADNHWILEPRQDFGSVSTHGKSGAAVITPFEIVDLFYCSMPGSAAPNQPTMEWLSSVLHIKPLAVGRADAVNHPELEDPLQDYIVRFTTSITVFDKIDFRTFRPRPAVKKLTRFKPVLESGKAYTEFDSPAVPWFTGQKENPRIAAFSGYNNAAEFFEFFRRFKSNHEVLEGWGMLGPGDVSYCGYNLPAPVPFAEKILNGKIDLLIMPGFIGKNLPANFKKQLINKIKSGTVAVYISDANRFTELFPKKGGRKVPACVFAGLPVKPEVTEFKVGKGKVFFVPFRLYLNNRFWSQHRTFLPVPDETKADDEYYFAMYAKLFRYALGYKSPAVILSAKRQNNSFLLEVKSDKNTSAAINGKKYQLKRGINKIVFPFKAETLNGKHNFDLLLDVEGARSDIFVASYEVKQTPYLKSFAPAKYAHESAESVKGTAEISGKGNIKVKLQDAEGRTLAVFSKKNVSGKVAFALKPQLFGVNALCTLSVELDNGKNVVEKRACFVSSRTPDNSRLRFLLWHNSNSSPAGKIRHRMTREMGFTHLLGSQGHATGPLDAKVGAELIQQTGARYVVNTLYRFFQRNIAKEKKLHDPCLRDPAGLAKIRKQVREISAKHKDFFPVLYTSADENSLGWHDVAHDYCHSPFCLAAFRKEMKKKYKNLSLLNNIWKTSFKTWESVTPRTLAQSHKAGNYASFIAHRNFMFGALDNGVGTVLDELRKQDRKARLSHSGQGLTRFNDGWDWRIMLKHYSLSSLYATSGGLPDFIRTVKPGYPAGNWNGYGAPLEQIRFTTWNDITDGLFAPAYWYDPYFYRRGDNLLNAAGLHMKKLIAEINSSGADPLMTTGRREKSPFTIVYSPSSLIAAAATANSSAINPGVYSGNLVGWSRMLRSAGFPAPQMIGDDMLASVNAKNTPALILPLFQQMSSTQTKHILQYVKDGGVLVIDAQAGIMNDLYAFNKENALLKAAGVKVPLAKGASAGTVLFGTSPLRVIPTGAEAESTGAKALGSVTVASPGSNWHSIELGEVRRTISTAFFINSYGKGKILYINGLLHAIPAALNDPALANPLIDSFRKYFAAAGISPRSSGGADINFSEYVCGRYRTLTVTRRGGNGTVKFTLPLEKSSFVYDVLNHKYLGKTSEITLDLKAWQVEMLVMTQEKAAAPSLTANKNDRGITVSSASNSGIWSAKLFRNGKELKSLKQNVILDKNNNVSFDFGISPDGECQVQLVNILNGKTFNCKVNFK